MPARFACGVDEIRFSPPLRSHIIVSCPDGLVRHQGWFPTWQEAEFWCEWGHACLSVEEHKFTDKIGEQK